MTFDVIVDDIIIVTSCILYCILNGKSYQGMSLKFLYNGYNINITILFRR